MVFLVVMYGSESWTIKKAEHQKVDAFEPCCWRRLLRVPWTARRSNWSILKEISPEYSLEGLILRLKSEWDEDVMENPRSSMVAALQVKELSLLLADLVHNC